MKWLLCFKKNHRKSQIEHNRNNGKLISENYSCFCFKVKCKSKSSPGRTRVAVNNEGWALVWHLSPTAISGQNRDSLRIMTAVASPLSACLYGREEMAKRWEVGLDYRINVRVDLGNEGTSCLLLNAWPYSGRRDEVQQGHLDDLGSPTNQRGSELWYTCLCGDVRY